MTICKPVRQLALGCAVVFALSACGGNDGNQDAPAPVPEKPKTASRVAATALWALQGASMQLQMSQQAQANQRDPAMAAAAGLPDTRTQAVLPCTSGGTVDVRITSLLPFTLSAAFAGCTQTVVSFNGALSLSATAFFQNGSLLGFDTLANNFEVSVGPVAQRLNGDSHVAIVSLSPVTLEASSQSLVTESKVAGVVTTSASLSGLTARLVVDTNASAVTSNLSFLARGSFIGLGEGSLQVQTLIPLVTPFGALSPSSGKIRVTRDQLEVTTITSQGDTMLIESDTNGDGVIDSSEVVQAGDLWALLG